MLQIHKGITECFRFIITTDLMSESTAAGGKRSF